MSNSLVRKSLELLGYEHELKQSKKKKEKDRSKGVLDLIPANHRLINKRKKTDFSGTLSRSSKITVHEAKKQLKTKTDPTEENVRRLLLLSDNPTEFEIAEKLIDRAVKKRYIPKQKKEVDSVDTVFTEEDFKRFEQEYTDD